MPLPVEEIKKLIKDSIPDAYIEINDLHKMEMNETDIQKLMIENRNKNI